MARFPRTEPQVIALAQAMVSGLTGGFDDFGQHIPACASTADRYDRQKRRHTE